MRNVALTFLTVQGGEKVRGRYIVHYNFNRVDTYKDLKKSVIYRFKWSTRNFSKCSVSGLNTNETTGGYYNYIIVIKRNNSWPKGERVLKTLKINISV